MGMTTIRSLKVESLLVSVFAVATSVVSSGWASNTVLLYFTLLIKKHHGTGIRRMGVSMSRAYKASLKAAFPWKKKTKMSTSS